MCKSESEIYYDDKRQVLWCESWTIPIEAVGVGRLNGYERKVLGGEKPERGEIG